LRKEAWGMMYSGEGVVEKLVEEKIRVSLEESSYGSGSGALLDCFLGLLIVGEWDLQSWSERGRSYTRAMCLSVVCCWEALDVLVWGSLAVKRLFDKYWAAALEWQLALVVVVVAMGV
jgi:hypothetical protein